MTMRWIARVFEPVNPVAANRQGNQLMWAGLGLVVLSVVLGRFEFEPWGNLAFGIGGAVMMLAFRLYGFRDGYHQGGRDKS